MSLSSVAQAILPQTVTEYLREQQSRRILRSAPEFAKLAEPNFSFDPASNSDHIKWILDWLRLAIEKNGDGGIPSMINLRQAAQDNDADFGPSYPETTGYFLSTLVFGTRFGKPSLDAIMLRSIAAYLCNAQLPSGGYPPPGAQNARPLAFDTGQALIGLASYHRHIDPDANVREAITRAAEWLALQIDGSGAYSLESCYQGRRAYYIRATMGLINAAGLFQREDWREKAEKQLDWTLAQKTSSVWFQNFSFEHGKWQNLHGIAYTIEALIHAGVHLQREDALVAARQCLDRLRDKAYRGLPLKGAIPGFFSTDFETYRTPLSPTGMCQTALCALRGSAVWNDASYGEFARRLVDCVKRCHFSGFFDQKINGLLPGSWPVYGPYMHCALPNWPIKFFLDALYVCEGAPAAELEQGYRI